VTQVVEAPLPETRAAAATHQRAPMTCTRYRFLGNDAPYFRTITINN
jgi:hypothetical protein